MTADKQVHQQFNAVNNAFQQQAAQIADVYTQQGKNMIDDAVEKAMQEAQTAAAGELTLYAQEKLHEMAMKASAGLGSLASLAPAEMDQPQVFDIEPVQIALPEASKRFLPANTRMQHSLPCGEPQPSKAAKRRERRRKQGGQD